MAPLPQVQNSSEDCLYLNVYTPVPKKHAEAGRGAARKPALLPVMVYAASPIAVPTARAARCATPTPTRTRPAHQTVVRARVAARVQGSRAGGRNLNPQLEPVRFHRQ